MRQGNALVNDDTHPYEALELCTMGEGCDRTSDNGCCNCGLPLLVEGHLHVKVLGVTFKVCSEGCAIQIVARGDCTTLRTHPWGAAGVDLYTWEPDEGDLLDWPELGEIRDRTKAARGL